jgi:hypothetical protein
MSVNTSVELHYKFYLYIALPFRQKGNNDLKIRLDHWSRALAKKSPKMIYTEERKGRQDWPFTFSHISFT